MNASSNKSPTTAATMAFSTKAAAPIRQSFSKTDSITQPKTRVRPILRALLKTCVADYELRRRHLITKAASIGLRRELSNLVHFPEAFRSHREEHVAR